MYHRKKIAVFISHIYGDYQSRLCSGIVKKAREYGYLVEFFASNDGESLGDYGTGEFNIINIPIPDNYAGVILASGTYLLSSLEKNIVKLLEDCFSCPVVDINQISSSYPRIALENHEPVKDLVLHLGRVHHYKNICYLGSSTQAGNDSLRRQAFIEGMNALSLPVKDNIYSCGFSRESLTEALEQILASASLPEAIVCYNDKLAVTAISVLKERGFHVPEQIAVTGCDTLEFGQMTSPLLTSVTFPINEVGEMAVEQLSKLLHKEKLPPVTTVFATPSIGTSCGCLTKRNVSSYSYAGKLAERIDSLEQNLILDMHMSANLQGVEDIDKGLDVLAGFAMSLSGCREFYLCLYEDWNRISGHIREITLTPEDEYHSDTVLLKLAIKDGKRLPECTFTKRSMLPDYLYDKDTASYVYAPLFFGEKNFGYLALSFTDNKVGYSFSFISWLLNVNNMLKSLCDKKNLGLLVGRLEDIYTKDELTGLLNRQGFKLKSVPAFEQAIADKRPVCAFLFDLDGLKLINDTYGHAEGSFAIQVLAHALENAAAKNDICSRQDSDVFHVLGFDYTPEKAARLADNVQKYLDNYNRLHTKAYHIRTSCGYCVCVPEKPSELAEMYEEADRLMYENKRSKEKQI